MLKKIKSLFIIPNESSRVDQATDSTGKVDQTSNPGPTGLKEISDSAEGGEVKDKFLNVLLKAMDHNDLDGFDYLEFKQFVLSLKSVDMDEETKYKSAFATAQTMGATVDKIRNSADHYLQILASERTKFDEAVKKQRTRVLEQQKKSIQNLVKSVEQKKARIDQLEQEIEQARKKIDAKEQELQASEGKVARTNADFIRTYNVLVDQIKDDLQKINTFLS